MTASRPSSSRGPRRALHRVVALLAALTLAVSATACGGDGGGDVEADPAGALIAAVESFADWQGLELRVRLDADDTARQELLREGELSEDEADLLLDGSVDIAVTDPGDGAGAMQLAVRIGGDVVAELRLTGDERFFVRVDLGALGPLLEPGDDLMSDLDELIAMAEMFGLGEAAQALADGSWIEIAGLEQLAELADMGDEQPEPDAEELTDAIEALSALTVSFLERDVQVTYVGSDGTGERVRATATGAAVERYLAEAVALLDTTGTAGGFGADALSDAGGIGAVSIDAWIRDGELVQLAVDLTDLDDADLEGELLLIVELSEFRGGIDAPSGAVEVDLFGLLGGFLGGGFGGDPFGDDLFGDEDDLFGDEDDLFGDAGEEDLFGDADDDLFGDDDGLFGDPGDDLAGDCITEQELAELELFLGEEGRAEIEALIDAGFLEMC